MPKPAKKSKQSRRRLEQRVVDTLMGYVAFIGPLSASPQVISIFLKQEARGVSLTSWIMFMCLGLVTLPYGIMHRLKPIIISQTLWLFIDMLLIIGIAMYGSGNRISLSYETLLLLNNIGKACGLLSIGFGAIALYYTFGKDKA